MIAESVRAESERILRKIRMATTGEARSAAMQEYARFAEQHGIPVGVLPRGNGDTVRREA